MRKVSWVIMSLLFMGAVVCIMGCGGGGGGENNPPSSPPSVNLEVNKTQVNLGEEITITWTSQNATGVKGCSFGSDQVTGSMTVTPKATTTYSITVSGSDGSTATDSATVTVNGDVTPIVSIEADKTQIRPGESAKLTWTSKNAVAIRDGTNFNAGGVNGSVTVTPQTTTVYMIMVANQNGEMASDSVTITVIADPPPTVSLEADKQQVNAGETVKLTWTSTNAATVTSVTNFTADGVNGATTVTPQVTTMYSITVSGQDGKTATASVTVAINELVNIPPGTGLGDSIISSADIMLNSETYAEVKVFRATRTGTVEVQMLRGGENPIRDPYVAVLQGEAHTVEEILRIQGPNNEGLVAIFDDISWPYNPDSKGYFQAQVGQLYTVVFTTFNRDFGTYQYKIREVDYRKSSPRFPVTGNKSRKSPL